jgi:hypothetical protein
MKKYWYFIKLLWVNRKVYLKIAELASTDLWEESRKAVYVILADKSLTIAAKDAPYVSYCARCGQLPAGDRRFEEARELVVDALKEQPSRVDLDLALQWHYWRYKRNA